MSLPYENATSGEREKFEAWYCADAESKGVLIRESIAHLRDGDDYDEHRVMLNGKWKGWKARAALSEAKAQTSGEREELIELAAWHGAQVCNLADHMVIPKEMHLKTATILRAIAHEKFVDMLAADDKADKERNSEQQVNYLSGKIDGKIEAHYTEQMLTADDNYSRSLDGFEAIRTERGDIVIRPAHLLIPITRPQPQAEAKQTAPAEQKLEYVAEVTAHGDTIRLDHRLPIGTKLYIRREPPTDEQIDSAVDVWFSKQFLTAELESGPHGMFRERMRSAIEAAIAQK